MNSKDIQNLSEAYLSIYSEEFKDLTPEKEKRVVRNMQRLTGEAEKQHGELRRNIAKYHARKANPVAMFLFGNRGPKKRVAQSGAEVKKTLRQLETSRDAISKTHASREARKQYLKNRLKELEAPRNVIVPFHREEVEFILNHLLDEGYVDSYESASAIMRSMSEEWSYEILNESSLADMFKKIHDQEGEQIRRNKEAIERIQKLRDQLSSVAPDEPERKVTPRPPGSSRETLARIKRTLSDAEKRMAQFDKEKH